MGNVQKWYAAQEGDLPLPVGKCNDVHHCFPGSDQNNLTRAGRNYIGQIKELFTFARK